MIQPPQEVISDSQPAAKEFQPRGLGSDHFMKYFFGSSAACAILALALITVFLFREGVGFFPQNLENLRTYRLAGLEYVDIMREQVDAHSALSRVVQELRQRQLDDFMARGMMAEAANASLGPFDQWTGEFDGAIDELRALVSELGDTAAAAKEKVLANSEAAQPVQNVTAGEPNDALALQQSSLPRHQQASAALRKKLNALLDTMPHSAAAQYEKKREGFQRATLAYLATFPDVEQRLRDWNPARPVPWFRALSSFLFGREWITNSFWQDWYGVGPLLTGSVLVSFVALVLAVPFGVCSAIYVSEVASVREQRFIKPYIEFVSAIPSVVLGFFGIAVFGETVRWLSQLSWLSWVPGFPVSERLNVFTAGALLALMAVPTIFSLSEDALQNVPRAFKEASYALGATRLQTVVRVIVPASLSGIFSAVLLGFGRVIGETMVVLLCAGNRIAIPDFAKGFSVMFEPVHTMTGIIAQEMGEVVRGSIHYRALFMVGVLLFMISLGINYAAQAIVRRYRVSIGRRK